MTTIKITTEIQAPKQMVFDLSRNIGLHLESTAQTKEQAIAGVTIGLISLNETVTWRAKHFGIWLTHKSLISEMSPPGHFTDIMTKGAFKSFRHDHYFRTSGEFAIMEDIISYETPFGVAGKLFDLLVLKNYLRGFIVVRNRLIKDTAERNFVNALVSNPY